MTDSSGRSGKSKSTNFISISLALVGVALTALALVVGFSQLSLDFLSSRSSDSLQSTAIAVQSEQLFVLSELATARALEPVSGATATVVADRIASLEGTLQALDVTKQRLDSPEAVEATSVPIAQDISAKIVLSDQDDNNYDWKSGAPYETTQFVFEGETAFIPTGNNNFSVELGLIGFESDEIRYVQFELFLLEREASLLFQAKVEGSWEHRWGFDGRSTYSGIGYRRLGQTLNLPVQEWIEVKLDLIEDLGARPGQHLKGLAFSGNDGKVVYDYVILLPSTD